MAADIQLSGAAWQARPLSLVSSLMHSRRRIIIASLLALLWLAAMLAAFWWFQARYIRPFDERTELFIGSQLRLPAELAGPGAIRLVHFWDPACPCNVGNQQHLGELVAAERAGRRCYAMELDPVYCDVAVRRWELATEKLAKKSS